MTQQSFTATPLAPIRGFAWMLAALVALGPLAIDAYLPAIPMMAEHFDTSLHQIELTLSLFLLGFAAGQLFGGPFSDRHGRRLTILIGLSLFMLGSLITAFGTQVEMLWLGRLLQAFGGGMGVVNTMAMVRDRYSGQESAQVLSQIVTILMIAPLAAPFIGSFLLLFADWRAIFLFLFTYAVILLLVLRRHLPETQNQAQVSMVNPVKRYLGVLKSRPALAFLFSVAMANAGMFAFITGSPGVYMGYFGASEQLYPFLFGANIVTLTLANQLNIRLLRRYSAKRILAFGQLIQIIMGICMVVSLIWLPLELWALVPLVMLFIGMQGLIVANGMSSATDFFPHSAATATALISASGFTLGAVSGALVGFIGDGSPLAMVGIMAACPIVGFGLRSWLQRQVIPS
ncbi:multidrug effflux MFS transporter [Aliidiomarina maris]|uniref:Bcr/CflA family efflux transporter n=2 Tax=Aliidiomarina maris TaxID=531312 RepID=A0A327WNS9_9GAMM|nr:multidrug effflux MFS transporter [Aliidiomarina maris]MCL5050631.1 multidrug effflux MFS transporter [Bacillota bacterium]RAJ93531.1 DHA1 family bicyclomycin/chloramphenicol resistance-like MFS transporter [Aliidiomarina maris]